MLGAEAYLLAQGEGSRWAAPLRTRFSREAPLYKQLLEINGEPLLTRSARLFREVGYAVTVIATEELLRLSGTSDIGLTIPTWPGQDILEAVATALDRSQANMIVVAYGDVLFSHAAIHAIQSRPSGILARCEPSLACAKTADEVFASWLPSRLKPTTLKRLRWMLKRGANNRPRKPWGIPFALSPDLNKTIDAYDTGNGLELIRDDLVAINDYTEDVDSPREWELFWPSLKTIAEADQSDQADIRC